ncbi:MAG: lipid-binding SYLF domain-containing protein [Patescibacteria group bacterium]
MARLRVMMLCLMLAALLLPTAALAGPSAQETVEDAARTLAEMSQQDDVAGMARLVRRAVGVAIFPKVIKAGLVLGGRHGDGLALRHGADGSWYGPCFLEISGMSIGAQIGVQSTALVLVVTNERGMRIFNGDKVTLGGEFAVAAGPVGRQAQAATDTDLTASIYSYSMSRGLFAGFSLEGAKIDDEPDANEAYWGVAAAPGDLLHRPAGGGIAPVVAELKRLMTLVE